jgi:hypothetical protein
MHEVWAEFKTSAATEFHWLEQTGYIAGAPEPFNVEDLLTSINDELKGYRRHGTPPIELVESQKCLYRILIRASILDRAIWETPSLAKSYPNLRDHRILLSKLIALREIRQSAPVLFTTNYDLAIEWAAEASDLRYYNGFDGLHLRQFAPQNFDLQLYNHAARGLARFGVYGFTLVKLHGSLTWRRDEDAGTLELPGSLAISDLLDFCEMRADELPERTMIFPHSGKYATTSQYIYGELFRRFADFLATRQTCLLISGYRFGDEHINRLLETGLNTPGLQYVIYYPDAEIDESGKPNSLPPSLGRIVERGAQRVVVVANGERAYFNALVADLPGTPITETLGSARSADMELTKDGRT